MNVLNRIASGIQAGLQVARHGPDFTKNLDAAIRSGQLDDLIFDDAVQKEVNKVKNNVEIYATSRALASFHGNAFTRMYANVQSLSDANKQFPHGDPQRDFILAEFWKHEPILSGAVYSMTAKMSTLSWTVIGKKRLANYFANIYDGALSMNPDGGWGDFISPTAQDFYTCDRGGFWVTPRSSTGVITELGVLDALCCAMTGNMQKPVFYNSYVTGQSIWFKPGEYAHFASMVSPREEMFGMGYCAVSRAYKAARILIGLTNYDWEKLNNLPPEGVAAVSGLTINEFKDSLALWNAERQKNKNLTYPQVLWLLGSQPNTQVSVNFTGFSQIPESFDRAAVIEQYVNLLSLDFGVDAREFWPVSTSSMGTAAESEIQHMKAKGKGPGEFISVIERYLNRNMPEGVEFSFDTQDIGEDMTAAEVAKGWVSAFMPLYSPNAAKPPGKPGPPFQPDGQMATSPNSPLKQEEDEDKPKEGEDGKPLITRDQFLRLLVDRRVLPEWIVEDTKHVRTDIGTMEKDLYDLDSEQPVKITWKSVDGAGVLEVSRLPFVEVIGPSRELPAATLKGGPGSGHHGHVGRPGKRGGSASSGSASFQSWFGNSKVVDESGKPLVVYHGTTSKTDYTEFKPSYPRGEQLGFGIHFAADPKFADVYAEGDRGRVLPVYLKMENPLKANSIVWEGSKEFTLAEQLAKGTGRRIPTSKNEDGVRGLYLQNAIDITSGKRAERLIQAAGYDGVIYNAQYGSRGVYGGMSVSAESVSYIVFDSSQIKSATGNIGDYASNMGDITKQLEQLAEAILEQEAPSIRGKPLPATEALRGPRITRNALQAEIDRWHNHPILKKYVPEVLEGVLGAVE